MPVPKKKVSPARCGHRRAHHKLKAPGNIRPCPHCSEPMELHRVCRNCGYYRGKEVIEIPLD